MEPYQGLLADLTMPLESKRQARAMYAAKEGHSTLGIPQKVGAEFVAAGPASGHLPETKKPKSKPLGDHF